MNDRGRDACAFPPGSVVVVSGVMGAGKSTVAQLLPGQLPKACTFAVTSSAAIV